MTMRFFGALVLTLGIGLLLSAPFIVFPAHAQETPLNSATLTQEFITTRFPANQQPDSHLTHLQIDLQPDHVVIKGRFGSVDLSLTYAPNVRDGSLTLEPSRLVLGGMLIDPAQREQYGLPDLALDLQTMIATASRNSRLEDIEVTESELTVMWQRADPDAPAMTVLDNALSLTASENYFNGLRDLTSPVDPTLSNLYMDFRPGQAVLTATYTGGDSQVPLAITFAPVINDGLATWVIAAMTAGYAPGNAEFISQMNDDIVGSWRMYFNGLYRSRHLTGIELSDSTITLTWDSDTASPIAFDPDLRVLTVPEDAINSTFSVTDPAGYTISDVVIDLQPGQAVLTAKLNLPFGRVLNERINFAPLLNDGIIEWTVTNASLNGEPIAADIIGRYNNTLSKWWDTILWRTMADYVVTNITITDTEVRISTRSR